MTPVLDPWFIGGKKQLQYFHADITITITYAE